MAKALGSGRSRNSIISKARSSGLTLSSGQAVAVGIRSKKTRERPAPKVKAVGTVTKPAGPGINPQRIPDFKPPTIIPDREGAGPTVLELQTGMCRAPVGRDRGADQQHCGGQTDRVAKGSRSGIGGFETYCPSCSRRLQKPTPSRAR